MIFAIGSLVALQGYWIQNALKAQKEQFDRNVKTALMETVRKIEQEEVLYVAHQRLTDLGSHKLVSKKSKAPDFTDDALRKRIMEHDLVLNSIYNETFFREFSKKIENLGERVPEQRVKAAEYINERLRQENENLKNFIKNNDQLESKYSDVQQVTDWIDSSGIKNSEPLNLMSTEVYSGAVNLDLVKGIIHDLMLGERTVSERMGHMMLDTLLRSELQNMGITLPFSYAVQDKGKFVLASNANPVTNNSYKIRLFPSDSFQNNQFLYVAFPEKDNFLYKNMLGLFAVSAILVVLVGGIFYYSANSLISERKLAKVKNDFINNMTHELKTPVSSISLALEVIQDKSIIKTEEKTNRYLGIIKEENQRLSSQINKVLQMARLEQKQIDLSMTDTDLHLILDNVIRNMEVQLAQDFVIFKKSLQAEKTIVLGDSLHLTNIFYNLIDNALKYHKGQLALEIKTFNTSANEIAVEVIDNGVGISASDHERVFDKFYRVSTGDVHDVKGFGLGLSYVKNMVELHNGSVRLKSQANLGSVFTIIIPLIKTHDKNSHS